MSHVVIIVVVLRLRKYVMSMEFTLNYIRLAEKKIPARFGHVRIIIIIIIIIIMFIRKIYFLKDA